MAKFDQRGQHVVNQVNAESIGSINFGAVQNKAELVVELRKLLSEVTKATQTGAIKEKTSVDIETHIRKAIIEVDEPQPKKETILDHIEGARSLLEGVSSATGLVTALMQAAKIAGEIFR